MSETRTHHRHGQRQGVQQGGRRCASRSPTSCAIELGLTGTHLGCEHGVCGACTILLDGHSARSCLMLAVQADGHEVMTVEGIAPSPDKLHPLQEAFRDNHGLQCGFCTPGMLTTLIEFLRDNPDPTEQEVRDRDLRQSLPLHRLPGHRARRARRREAPEGGEGLKGIVFSVIPGPAEGRSPESKLTVVVSGFRIAASRRPE